MFSVYAHGQRGVATGNNTLTSIAAIEIPAAVLTRPGAYWTISTISALAYVNSTPGSSYKTSKDTGGLVVKFRFLPDNRFDFIMYVRSDNFGTGIETWTQYTGNGFFSKDAKGQEVFTTQAEKGVYRIIKNGAITTRAIPENELKMQHSNTYLWETTNFKDNRNNKYLLMVNIDEHPGADINHPETIHPQWVSRFHVPDNK